MKEKVGGGKEGKCVWNRSLSLLGSPISFPGGLSLLMRIILLVVSTRFASCLSFGADWLARVAGHEFYSIRNIDLSRLLPRAVVFERG